MCKHYYRYYKYLSIPGNGEEVVVCEPLYTDGLAGAAVAGAGLPRPPAGVHGDGLSHAPALHHHHLPPQAVPG